MTGNWTKNPEAFEETLKYSRALRDAVVALDLPCLQAIIADPEFHHTAITPAVIGKAHRLQQEAMVTLLMNQATSGVQHSVIEEMSRATVPIQELAAMIQRAPIEQQPKLAGHAIFKGGHFKREEAFFEALLNLVPLQDEELKRPLLKWAGAHQWALVEHTLDRMTEENVPWGELLLRLSKEGVTPSESLLTRTLAQAQDPTMRDNAFNSAARTGNLALLNHMMAHPQGWTPPFAQAFETAWVKNQASIIERLFPLTDFDQVGALLAARIPRQAHLPDTDPDKVTWPTLDRLGQQLPLAVQERWLVLYAAADLPMTQASARRHQANRVHPEGPSSRRRSRSRT